MTTYTNFLKYRKPAVGQTSWADEMHENVDIDDFVKGGFLAGNVVLSGCAPSIGTGLDVDYAGGEVSVDGTRHTITAGSKTCTANVMNFLCVDNTGAVQIYTTAPTASYAALAVIDAGAAALDRVINARKLAEGAAAFDLTYTPDNYAPDTGESKEIEQHLAGIDAQIGLMGRGGHRIINGDMAISQRGTSFVSPAHGDYTLDRYAIRKYGTQDVTITQESSGGPTDNLPNWLKVQCTTALPSPSSTEFFLLGQRIEGYLIRDLFGANFTISFWVRSTVTGTFSLGLRNDTPDRSYATLFTVSAADTWEYKTLTIPMDTMVSSYDVTNGIGLRVDFALLATSGRLVSANDTWLSEDSQAAIGAANALSSTSNVFGLTGLKLQKGDVATSFIRRSHGLELLLCQRYYQEGGEASKLGSQDIWCGDVTNGNAYLRFVPLRPYMRDYPHTFVLTHQSSSGFSTASLAIAHAGNRAGFRVQMTSSATTARGFYRFTWTADAEL